MPLTEEQRLRMEENRRKALEKKRNKLSANTEGQNHGGEQLAGVPIREKRPVAAPPCTLADPNPRAANSFRKKSSVQGSAVLISAERFAVKIGYHEAAVEAFKRIRSASYQACDRLWTFAISDHDKLMVELQKLKDDLAVNPLPKWILRAFSKPQAHETFSDSRSLRSVVEPSLLDALMPFQREGIEFALKRNGRVLIADDMGLGKTIQALGIASAYRSEWPLLIVCPSSVRFSWKDSVIRWLPSVAEEDIMVITSGKDYINNASVVIISYDLLCKKEQDLIARKCAVAILDESHFVKNHKSNRFKSSEKVVKNCKRVILLSGTPALSRPIELYSQISLVSPKMFPFVTSFGKRYCDGKQVNFGARGMHYDFSGCSNMEELRILLETTSMIRRLKTDVLLQLPSKQRKMIILDPALVKSKTKEMEAQARRMGQKSLTSAERRGLLLEWFNMTGQYKVKGVLEYLKDLLEGDKKFLCFAHHQSMMNAISDMLEVRKVRFIRIDGNTSSESRNRFCEQFQGDETTKVALLSITAANAGITLTSAQLVVFAELFWNPGILTQAEDRAHRIGQTDSVAVQYLVAQGTADDELWPLLQRKLDVLNKAGLSKDNFTDSDASYVATKVDCNPKKTPQKITDYFSTSALEDLKDWEADDSFGLDVDGDYNNSLGETGAPGTKKAKLDVRTN